MENVMPNENTLRDAAQEQPAQESRAYTREDFETAALPHLDALYRTARRILQERAAAEDVVQDTYLQAWKSFHRFQLGTDCRAWLFTILFNEIRHFRRKWQDRWVDVDSEEPLEQNLAYSPPIPEEVRDEDVLSALEAIPAEFRAVVLLADVQEFSYREIAEILNVPTGTVMSRLSRGRKLLRASLGEVARTFGLNKADALEGA
jgi:RNA polymerase sigma-70 factor, ECF subfamily